MRVPAVNPVQSSHVDPSAVTRAATGLLDVAAHLAMAARCLPAAPPAGGADQPAEVSAFYRAHLSCAEDVATALERLAQALDGDADRLYQVAFSYEQADQDAARRGVTAGRGMPGSGTPPRPERR